MKRNARKKNNREKNCRKRKTKNVKRLALWHQQHGTSALSIYTSWLPILADCWMHTRAQVLTSLLLSILCVYMLLVFAHFVVRTSCIVPSHCITLHRTSMYKQRQKCKNKRHLFFQSLADKKNSKFTTQTSYLMWQSAENWTTKKNEKIIQNRK